MVNKKIVMASVGAGAVALTGAALLLGTSTANADPTSPSPTTSASAGAKSGRAANPSANPSGGTSVDPSQGTQGSRGQGRTQGQAPQHTEVTGDEAAKVTAAVTAKDSAVQVTKVEKDADGSYDVTGTKDGSTVRYEVSADLGTVTEGAAKGNGGAGGQGQHEHTAVTGDEAAKVTAAVTAKDSAFQVTSVQKDPDGSYDVAGTKDGQRAMAEVSADLGTVTVRTGR